MGKQQLHTKNIIYDTQTLFSRVCTISFCSLKVFESVPYPCEVHAQFELGEQVENDAPLVVQDTQVLLFVILRICHLFSGADVFQPCVVLRKQE